MSFKSNFVVSLHHQFTNNNFFFTMTTFQFSSSSYILIGITIDNQIVIKKALSYLSLDEYALNVVICDYNNDRHLEFWPLYKNTCRREETGINEIELASVHKFDVRPTENVDECFIRAFDELGIVI